MIEERATEAVIKELKIIRANDSDTLRKLLSIYFIYCQILIAQLVKAQKNYTNNKFACVKAIHITKKQAIYPIHIVPPPHHHFQHTATTIIITHSSPHHHY